MPTSERPLAGAIAEHGAPSPTGVRPRRRLFRWAGWFGLAHAALLGIVGLRYLWYYRPIAPSAGWAYAALAFVGHLSALAYLPLFVVLLPLIALAPQARIVVPVGVAVASAGLSLLTASMSAPGTR